MPASPLHQPQQTSAIRSDSSLPISQPSSLSHSCQARLVETGAKKLAQLFTKAVASGSSGSPPAGPEFQLSVFPREELATLLPLVKSLRGLPLPATHPSHPAAAVILSALKEAQRGYAEMRGNWARKCLELYGRRVVDRSETTDGVLAGQELGIWTRNLLDVIEVSFLRLYACCSANGSHRKSTAFSRSSPRSLAKRTSLPPTLHFSRLSPPFLTPYCLHSLP